MAAPIVHVEVRGLDEPLLRSFYADIFGWMRSEELSIDDYSISEIGGNGLTAATGRVADWHARECLFYIQVDDLDETLTKIEAAGGKAVMPKTVGPDDFPAEHIRVFTQFIDPAGNVVGLVETPRPRSNRP
ncbi:MAG: VOC family protein [Acidimicrobiia bacterium]|nr:VOC family protein [Acidimicrobiia bacterium]